MKKRTAMLLAVMAFFGLGTNLAIAGAETVNKIPYAGDFETCNETVSLSGWSRLTFNFHFDNANGVHATAHFRIHAKGEGQTTGTRYVLNDTFENLNINGTTGMVLTITNVRRTNLISLGPLENTVVYATIHSTLRPDGTVTVDRFEMSAECVA